MTLAAPARRGRRRRAAAHRRNRVRAPRRSARPRARRRADRGARRATAARSAGSPARRPARRAREAGASPPRRTAARRRCARSTPSITSLDSAWRAAISPTMRRDLRAIERRERNDAVVRAQAPGRAELRPGRRDDEQRRLRAALGERPQQIERGRVGPVQVLEGEHDRLRSARRPETKAVIAASCRRRNSSGANFAARSSGSGMSNSGASRGAYSAGSRPISRRVFSRSASRCSAGASRAKAQPAPFGDRVQRRVLQQLRRRPLDPGVRRLAEPGVKLLDQPRLAEARLADDQHELTLALARALPAPAEQIEFLLAPDERRQRARAAASAAAARANDAIERDRLRYALEFVRAAVLGDEQPGDLPLHVSR